MRRITTVVAVAVALLSFAGAACAQDPADSLNLEGDSLDMEALAKVAGEAIDGGSLQKRFDLVYEPGEQKPFSGWAAEYHDNGQIESLGQYKDGKRHGQEISWYGNGQMRHRGPAVNGHSNGQWTYWHDNGQMQHQGDWVDGQFSGQWTGWYENGNMQYQGEYEGGNWNTFKRNSAGTRAFVGRVGKWTFWEEDGSKYSINNFVDGKKHGFSAFWLDGRASDPSCWVNGELVERRGRDGRLTNVRTCNGQSLSAWKAENGIS